MPPYAGLDEAWHVARVAFVRKEHRNPTIVERSIGACIRRLTTIRSDRAIKLRMGSVSGTNRADPKVLADREARNEALRRRSPASIFLNDPPPGYSALDRKRQGLAP